MFSRLVLATLLSSWLAVGASASQLFESLATASATLQRLQLSLNPEWPVDASAWEGVEFADPVLSTIDAPQFGSGPELRYDTATGDVTITAPPVLGPADEFGQRDLYAPSSILLRDSGLRGDSPSFPTLIKYLRNSSLAAGSPSFVAVDSGDSGSSLYWTDNEIRVSGLGGSGSNSWAGATLTLSDWLEKGIAEELFEKTESPELTDTYDLYDYRWRNYQPLADIEVIIDYQKAGERYLYSNDQRRLRADPIIFDSVLESVLIPEPTGLALVAGLLLALPQRR